MLPFKPTGAQKRVLGEIAHDMAAPHPMYRLLQGDVGSGKTLVAAEAAIIAIENGYQVAVLAPTEILAAQHYFYFKKLFQKLGYITILADRLEHGAREDAAQEAGGRRAWRRSSSGRTRCLKPTSSSPSWVWRSSTSSIVSAWSSGRSCSKRAGKHPDVLVMTATPIPRTLALDHLRRPGRERDRRNAAGTGSRSSPSTWRMREVEQVYSFRAQADRRGLAGLRGVSGD